MKKVLLLIFILFGFLKAQDKIDYSPKFSGYIRAWHQTDFAANQGQFSVKQARLGINGSVNEYAGYKFLVDFTRLGRLSTTSTTINDTEVLTGATANFSDILLDAAAMISPLEGLQITAGQFKVPFSTDNLRADQNADFSNRPMQTNVSPSIRDIGAMVTYKIKGDISAEFSGGTFNGSGMNKSENNKSMDYAFRAVVSPIKDMNVSGNYYSGKTGGTDLDYFNFGFDYKIDDLFLDAEFTNKNSKSGITDFTGNSVFGYATYKFKIGDNFLKDVIAGFRYEKYDPNTDLDNNEIDVLTFGLTFEFAKINFAHVRINYEFFDYKDGRDNPNKLIIELQTRF